MATDPATLALLKRHEGLKLSAYQDSLGFWTIGYGRLIDARKGGGISSSEAETLLENDLKAKAAGLDTEIPWWRGLDLGRQRALLDLAFNLGVQGLLTFHHALACLANQNWQGASDAFQTSLWARQVGQERTQDVVSLVLNGDTQHG